MVEVVRHTMHTQKSVAASVQLLSRVTTAWTETHEVVLETDAQLRAAVDTLRRFGVASRVADRLVDGRRLLPPS